MKIFAPQIGRSAQAATIGACSMADNSIYDLTLLLDSKVEDDEREKIVTDVESIIYKDGEIVERRDWGVRPTTFRLRDFHTSEADYRLLQFTGSNEVLNQLNHTLKITDGVMRFRIIKVKPGMASPPDLSREVVEPISDEELKTS